MTAQRSLAPDAPNAPSSRTGGGSGGGSTGDTISAAALAARITGTASPDTIRRTPESPRISTTSGSGSAFVQRAELDDPQSSSSTSGPATSETFESLLRDHFDLIVDLLEERIIVDLERRGGRFRGDF